MVLRPSRRFLGTRRHRRRPTAPCSPPRLSRLQLDPNDSVDTLKAVLEAETGLAAEQQRLLHNGRDVAAGCVKEGWSAEAVGSR